MSPFQWAGLSPQLISTLLTKWMGLQEGGRPYGSNFLSLAHSPSNIFQTSTGCPTPKWRLVAKIVYLALCFVSCKMHCCIKSEYVVGDVDGLSKVSTCVFFYMKIYSLFSLPPSIDLLSPLSRCSSLLIIYLQFFSLLFFSSHSFPSSDPLPSPLLLFIFNSTLLSFFLPILCSPLPPSCLPFTRFFSSSHLFCLSLPFLLSFALTVKRPLVIEDTYLLCPAPVLQEEGT